MIHSLDQPIPPSRKPVLPTVNPATPELKHPPIQVYHFSLGAFDAGIKPHTIDGVNVRVYSAEKTLADCFKYRNKSGHDVALDALRSYCARRGANCSS